MTKGLLGPKTEATRNLALLIEGREKPTEKTLRYLAGVIEARGRIGYLYVFLRMDGRIPIPKLFHSIYGGTFFCQETGRGNRGWFRVQGRRAEVLLREILPYLVFDQRRVAQFLALWDSGKRGPM